MSPDIKDSFFNIAFKVSTFYPYNLIIFARAATLIDITSRIRVYSPHSHHTRTPAALDSKTLHSLRLGIKSRRRQKNLMCISSYNGINTLFMKRSTRLTTDAHDQRSRTDPTRSLKFHFFHFLNYSLYTYIYMRFHHKRISLL